MIHFIVECLEKWKPLSVRPQTVRLEVYKEQKHTNETKIKMGLKNLLKSSTDLRPEERVLKFLRKFWLPLGFFIFISVYMFLIFL